MASYAEVGLLQVALEGQEVGLLQVALEGQEVGLLQMAHEKHMRKQGGVLWNGSYVFG